MGVSERTVRKWVARYAAEAEAGLADWTCRPRRSPGATPPLLVSWVEQRRRQRWTGGEIAQALQLSGRRSGAWIPRERALHPRRSLKPIPPRSPPLPASWCSSASTCCSQPVPMWRGRLGWRPRLPRTAGGNVTGVTDLGHGVDLQAPRDLQRGEGAAALRHRGPRHGCPLARVSRGHPPSRDRPGGEATPDLR
jgi:hypothetical protein